MKACERYQNPGIQEPNKLTCLPASLGSLDTSPTTEYLLTYLTFSHTAKVSKKAIYSVSNDVHIKTQNTKQRQTELNTLPKVSFQFLSSTLPLPSPL